MNHLQHILFLGMIAIYTNVIYNVCINYTSTDQSISSILKNTECNRIIFVNMIAMGTITLLYEGLRYDRFSLITMFFLVLGIYGVLYYDHTQTVHFVYCFVVFISILCFMIHHCCKTDDVLLYVSLGLQILLCIVIFFESIIIHSEVYLLMNFAFFYIYLHFSSVSDIELPLPPPPPPLCNEPLCT